jgi:F420-dependent oxidoreductase-like protein
MKLGVMIEAQQGLTWERWRRIMGRVEELGFESLWRSDHFMPLAGDQADALETWVALTLTAAETSRLTFGPLVCSMTFRHPALLARMAAQVDQLSGGRLVLGVGAGWHELEHRTFGLPFPPVKERMDRLEEGIEVLLRLMADGEASFDGRYYQLDRAVMLPKPAQRPRVPLLIGGGGERRTLRIVARYADEWNIPNQTPAAYRQKRAVLAEHCAAAGRDPEEIARSMMVAFVTGADTGAIEAHATALQRVLPRLRSVAAAEVPATVRANGWIAGTPDELIGQIRALEAAGVQRIMLQHHDQANFDVLDLIAREVLPAVAH